MYRGGINENLSDAAQSFISSVSSDLEIIPFDITATEAHVLMLHKSRIISKSDAKKLLGVLRDLRTGAFGADDVGMNFEDGHEMLESIITEAVGPKIGGLLQTARSRNDQVAVAIRMKLRNDTNMIQIGILQMVSALADMARDHTDTLMPLYTHLQHAQVGVLSHYLLAHAFALARDCHRFHDMYMRLDSNPLGSGPVGGTSLKIDRKMTTEMLSFAGTTENSLDATSSRDFISEFVSCTAMLCVNLSRIAEDLIIWSSDEFGFIDIPDVLASPSSSMPQKKNPDVLELIRGKAAGVIGDLTTVLAVQKGLASGYGRDLQETKEPAWRAAQTTMGSIQILFDVLTDMIIHKTQMAAAAESGNITALDMAERMVLLKVPFREAHQEMAKMAEAARRAGKQLHQLTPAEIRKVTTLKYDIVSKAMDMCTVRESANNRASSGSTSCSEQERMLDALDEKIDLYTTELHMHREISRKNISKMWMSIDKLLDS